MFSKKTKETAFFIVAIVLLWLIFNRQIRGFFTNIAGQLNIAPAPHQPVEQQPVEQPPVVQPVLPPIPNIPRLQMGFFTWDRLPWERNRTRIEVMEAIRSDMRRIKSFPYSVASTFPEVIGAGGVVPYLNAQMRRFIAAATASILIAGAPVPRPPDSVSGLVQAMQHDVVQPPVVQPPVVQPPLAPRPVLPPIPCIPRLQMGFFPWDRLPWERNRTRIEVMEAIRSDMRRIKCFPYYIASTFPEVIGAGGVVPYLNAQMNRFIFAANASIHKAGVPVPRPPDSASGLVQAVQRDEKCEGIEWGYYGRA